MKQSAYILFGLALIGLSSCREVRSVKVKVTEENGTAIEGAKVTVTFLGHRAEQTTKKIGETDGGGVFKAKGSPPLRMSARIEKAGYYATFSGRLSRNEDHDLNFVLRKRKNSTELYAKRVSLRIPKNGEWIGYDFEVGEWVSPHGRGKRSDILVRCDTVKLENGGGSGRLEFKFGEDEGLKLEDDGYQSTSDLKMPHAAPDQGYSSHFSRDEDSYHNKNARSGIGYFFRTRVRKENGRILTANYGKISSDVRFDPRQPGWHVSDKNKPKAYGTVSFTYYFNPTPNDRNLEFDPKKNLFQKLDSTERVHDP